MLSHEQVGMACLLSRAAAGVMGGKIVFCLPGSPKACKLAMEKIILPEAGHLVKHARGG
jgi:molybdenum cofactor biosynthesis protein B